MSDDDINLAAVPLMSTPWEEKANVARRISGHLC